MVCVKFSAPAERPYCYPSNRKILPQRHKLSSCSGAESLRRTAPYDVEFKSIQTLAFVISKSSSNVDVSSSLQIHASDCPYNSMSRTPGLTRATEIGSRRLMADVENLSKNNDENNCKEMNFQKSAVLRIFEKVLRTT